MIEREACGYIAGDIYALGVYMLNRNNADGSRGDGTNSPTSTMIKTKVSGYESCPRL